MRKPDSKDVFARKPGIFEWLRDQAYDFVDYERGTGLDFVGDMFRGPSGYSKSLHRQSTKAEQRTPQAKPLTRAERAVFADMLKRQSTEPQMAYWKRKKALLGNPDKQGLVKQQCALDATLAKRQTKHPNIVVEASGVSSDLLRSSPPRQTKAQTKSRKR